MIKTTVIFIRNNDADVGGYSLSVQRLWLIASRPPLNTVFVLTCLSTVCDVGV